MLSRELLHELVKGAAEAPEAASSDALALTRVHDQAARPVGVGTARLGNGLVMVTALEVMVVVPRRRRRLAGMARFGSYVWLGSIG